MRSDAARRDSYRKPSSAYDHHQPTNYPHQQPASNESDSNRSESIQSVESALYSSHQRTGQPPAASSTASRSAAGHESASHAKQPPGNQKDYGLKPKPSISSTNPILELASAFTESNRQRRQSVSGGHLYHRRSVGRLSVADASAGAGGGGLFRRRRAVEVSDQKACVLLHSKLKGMKLEDIA